MNSLLFDFFVNHFAAGNFFPRRLRNLIYRRGGIKSKSKTFGDHCYFSGANVIVGEGVYINRCVYFDAADLITICNHVFIAMNVHFITSTHEIGNGLQRAGRNISKPIEIGDGCWIGCDTTILPGSNIGCGTIISGGSIVHGELESNCIYGGNPVKLIKRLGRNRDGEVVKMVREQ